MRTHDADTVTSMASVSFDVVLSKYSDIVLVLVLQTYSADIIAWMFHSRLVAIGLEYCTRPMLSDRCLSVCPVCDVRALWPNGWTDQDETWLAGRPRPWPHCV